MSETLAAVSSTDILVKQSRNDVFPPEISIKYTKIDKVVLAYNLHQICSRQFVPDFKQ